MSVDFEYDLDEIVLFDQRKLTLRTALRERKEFLKLPSFGQTVAPAWFRDYGKSPEILYAKQMDDLLGAVAIADLNAQ